MKTNFLTILFLSLSAIASAQHINYTGKTISNPYCLDGGLTPAIGVHNIQTMRTSRSQGMFSNDGKVTACPTVPSPILRDVAGTKGWTYNHQPMMAYWKGKFWMHYLSGVLGEHIPSSVTFMQSSVDGYTWSAPVVLFPDYEIPADIMSGKKQIKNADGSLHKVTEGSKAPAGVIVYPREGLKAIMHQRVGWYVSSKTAGEKLYAIGNYGICLDRKDDPNDGNGIGRVIREVKVDGTFGDVYFFYYNHGWNEKNTNFPNYKKSKDKQLIKAVDEILASPLYWMQFVEECDRNDAHLPLKNMYKAFCYYTLPDNTTNVALWKHALTSTSKDGGKTWFSASGNEGAERAKGFVNSNAKIWGQRLSDGSYATVYNPSEYRWPMGISMSADGVEYTTLNLVCGDISKMRYGGNYKSNGPQYVRGILPGNGTPADNDLWVTYSMNKEDMWVAHIPVPVILQATSDSKDSELKAAKQLADLREWNIYSPVLAPVTVVRQPGYNSKQEAGWLRLSDRDPFDYAKADRLFPAKRKLFAKFAITPHQNDHGELQVEFCDAQGNPCSRLCWQKDGNMTIKTGARYTTVMKYEANKQYLVKSRVNLDTRMIEVFVSSPDEPTAEKSKRAILYAPIAKIERITFRTGERRTDLTPDTPADRAEYEDLDNTEALDNEATFDITALHTGDDDGFSAPTHPNQDLVTITNNKAHLLSYDKMNTYVDYFNGMEDEHVAQAIPNSKAKAWMTQQIPLFDCPDKNMEEMYYYRWWTLRKHFVETPFGMAQTEFLVKRSYSDTLNLIACAVSHHIMEARWLHQPAIGASEAKFWLRGKQAHLGKEARYAPLGKLHKFTDLIPYSLYNEAKVIGNLAWMKQLQPDLEEDMKWWDENQMTTDGLYWQEDVRDGMEEQISGGKRYKGKSRFQQRPSINAYMAANYAALSELPYNAMDRAERPKLQKYAERSKEISRKMVESLWDEGLQFFGSRIHHGLPKQDKALPGDSIAQVRELIGYLPWYCMTVEDNPKFAVAWQQLSDKDGFDAPFGMTTAERRHPLFRKNWTGKPTCEWDGAIWPFATSQTLTALINIKNEYPATSAQIPDSLFFYHLKKYTESMHRKGRPYVGEYLDEKDGQWLWGDHDRSRYYNHSTYNDLIISGLVGIYPRLGETLTVNPLLPANTWNYFCLDGVRYHDHVLTIIWDADGSRYHQGKGLTILVNGKRRANRADLGKLEVNL